MSLNSLVGNTSIKEWLQKAMRLQRIPGALIFAGQSGVGKQQFAVEFAKSLNCNYLDKDFNSCDSCSFCQRITANQFPDTKIITPDGQFIKVDQIRNIIGEVYYRPFEGKYRVYIIEMAERLREQAANALLKTLEEPPSTSIIILLTSSLDSLLPTIRSRTIKLQFAPLSEEALSNYLNVNYPRPELEQKLLIKLAQGSIGRALSIDISEYLTRRQECLELLITLAIKDKTVTLLKLAENFGRKERTEFDLYLVVLLALLQDLLHLQISNNSSIINFDILSVLSDLAIKTPKKMFISLSSSLMALERDLIRNVNRQLALENIFLSLSNK
ncbi:MAG: DNA polymerase III subunit delta' [Blastocatellia bacterium]|nr:DNA polymerase III subunit delta' [Blastocatellia bacterium]